MEASRWYECTKLRSSHCASSESGFHYKNRYSNMGQPHSAQAPPQPHIAPLSTCCACRPLYLWGTFEGGSPRLVP